MLYFLSSKFSPSLEMDLLKLFACQIKNPLEDLLNFQENGDFQLCLSGPGRLAALRQLLAPEFSLFWCSLASPACLWLAAWTHSSLPRTSALINRHRLCFQEFQTCLDLSMRYHITLRSPPSWLQSQHRSVCVSRAGSSALR